MDKNSQRLVFCGRSLKWYNKYTMKTLTTLKNLFGSLSLNTSASNLTLGSQLISDRHRYLIQKYFDNERSVVTSTVGGASLTLTGSLASSATTATLTAVWAYPTCNQLVNFSNSNQRSVLFTYNSAAISWSVGLTATATTAITTVGVQDYNIPANVSKIKNDTISVGQLKYQPRPVQSRQEWDLINFLPYTSDIPSYFFIYGGKLSIFPIPSTTGNVITFNYKTRVPDLTYADFTTGTVGGTVGSTSITGASTTWNSVGTYPLNTDLTFANLFIQITPPKGDGIWYQIQSFQSDTALTLVNPIVNAPSMASGAAYTIGQIPLLSEDFHDMLVYGALKIYFSSIVPDSNKFKEYDTLEKERLELLKDYAGTKSVDVDLGGPYQQINPNLFYYANS